MGPALTVIAARPVATAMHSSASREFRMKMSHWNRNTSLVAIRPEVDRKDGVDNVDIADGRPFKTRTHDIRCNGVPTIAEAYDHNIAGFIAMLCTLDSGWCIGSVVRANYAFKSSF